MTSPEELALVTYSTKPRGGVVHTLSLAEAMHRRGVPVHLIALGERDAGFFRPTPVPHTIIPAPRREATLESRVFASLDTLAEGLADVSDRFDILHTQDCISARAAARVRDAGAPVTVVRTVHHVDDFTTPALIDCQRRAIFEPDRVLVVSEYWRELLRTEYDVESHVVHNGVDPHRFGPIPAELRSRLRKGIGAEDRFLFLAVGGVEPRKGTVHLFRAMSILKDLMDTPPVLAVVGGHSFQDYADYRDAALSALPALGLELGTDVVLLGTVPDSELSAWYRAADALAFPSVKEGWGLAVLEAMSAELPVIASDLPVFKEYLTDRRNALLTPVADATALARGMRELAESPELRTRLHRGSRPTVSRFTWEASAAQHAEIYQDIRSAGGGARPAGAVRKAG
ncbi:MSMEG_0565 family glycosyltransferase [Streptomyces sp. CA-106110]|uniref:MSMEG_0565 family glycosyltransferase n=1 Tax=Streptomyces sp. CA-106110 TaxID=3240044 RepID=UPI003D8C3048